MFYFKCNFSFVYNIKLLVVPMFTQNLRLFPYEKSHYFTDLERRKKHAKLPSIFSINKSYISLNDITCVINNFHAELLSYTVLFATNIIFCWLSANRVLTEWKSFPIMHYFKCIFSWQSEHKCLKQMLYQYSESKPKGFLFLFFFFIKKTSI